MLDIIRQLIADELEISTAEANRFRAELLAEQAAADDKTKATNALLHPEGSCTPINEAYSRAQNRLADLREKARKELPKALASLIALEIATQRRDEAKAHRDMKWDNAFAKDTMGVDPAVVDFWGRLHKHGVHPHHLKQLANEMVAIVADLIAWKAKDATFKDTDNPWRAVLGIYAGRRIEKPNTSRNSRATRSVAGTPIRNRHIPGMGDYIFDELVEPHWGLATPAAIASGAVEPAPASASPTFDLSIYPEDARDFEEPAETEMSVEPATMVTDASPDLDIDEHAGIISLPETAFVEPSAPTDQPPLEEAAAPAAPDAHAIAEAIFTKNHILMRIYWPSDWKDYDDFGSDTLLPALEAWVGAGGVWTGGVAFLAAAREGKAREFILQRRRSAIEDFVRKITKRDDAALKEARAAGFTV